MDAPVFVMGPSAGRADVPALSARLAAIVRERPAQVVVCDVRAITDPDARTVDVLARLQLAARRLGCVIRLYGAHPRLRDLLQLTGLSEVLPLLPPPGDRSAGLSEVLPLGDGSAGLVEVGREPEEREDPLDVQERVDRGDLAG
ncbi:STAS domain-containing protein [Phytohabitans sp. ZYX-F-186]|uniref:STAS domain-containing protein n=1 Tax=Phytohabitans maris TaxID=3071409 RepID=A0ABU0ZUQ5_9ACTN|nr:STAS domain-containing protein [Phytohabitans sp. ZYX-F-186]MDQ7910232.1 STAS domain-containing protein [Phytohabitans sp. ZYX-F-186]